MTQELIEEQTDKLYPLQPKIKPYNQFLYVDW